MDEHGPFPLRLARRGAARPGGGVPLCRLPARGHGRRAAGLPRRRRRRGAAGRPRAADAERRRRAAPLRLEPLQLGLPRARPLAPDRARASAPRAIHIVNVADDPRRPRIEKVIEPEELVRETGLTRPHTVHCMPGDNIVISMLGDADGNGACGFAVLDARTFEIKGRWENGGDRARRSTTTSGTSRARTCSPRRSSASPAPTSRASTPTTSPPGTTAAGCTSGTSRERRVEQTLELGETGLVPLEIRWLHDPDADEGFVGAALSSTMWHFHRENGSYAAEPVIAVDSVEQEGWPFPVPGLITDLVVSMDDRFLYFSNWLHGDLRQYDISDPGATQAHRPALARRRAGQAVRRRARARRRPADAPALARRPAALRHELAVLDLGQPVLSGAALLDAARRLPPRRRHGDRPRLLRRLPRPPGGPARAHEVRLQGGDCTTEIFQ